MFAILASILSSLIVLPIMLAICCIVFLFMLALYASYCIGLRKFLIKNEEKTSGFWIPIYNLYLMGIVLEDELLYKNKYFHYAKYIMPILCVLTFVSSGILCKIVSILYICYKIFCYHYLGQEYQDGILLPLFSIFNFTGIGLLICARKI